jgi:hypothetical protein
MIDFAIHYNETYGSNKWATKKNKRQLMHIVQNAKHIYVMRE